MVIRVLFNDKQLKKAAIDGCLFYWEYIGGVPLGVVWLVVIALLVIKNFKVLSTHTSV
jgi:hypothetical protein